jgi:hypothetical protein
MERTKLTHNNNKDIIKTIETWTSDAVKIASKNIPKEFMDVNNILKKEITMDETHKVFNTAMMSAVLALEKLMIEKGLQYAIIEDAETDMTPTDDTNAAKSDAGSENTITISASTTVENRNSTYYNTMQLQELAVFPEMAGDLDVINSNILPVPHNCQSSTMTNRTWLEMKSLFRYASSDGIDKKAITDIDVNKRQSVNLYGTSSELDDHSKNALIEGWGEITKVTIDPREKSYKEKAYGDSAEDWKDFTLYVSFAGVDLGIKGMIACLWKTIRRNVTKWKTMHFLTNRTIWLSELCKNTRLHSYRTLKSLAENMENIAFNHKNTTEREKYIVIGSYAGNGLASLALYEIAETNTIWPLMFMPNLPTGLVRTIDLEQGFKVRKDIDRLRYNWQIYGDKWNTAPSVIPASIWSVSKGSNTKYTVDNQWTGNKCWTKLLPSRHYSSDNDNRYILGSAISILALMHLADTEPLMYTTCSYVVKNGLSNSHSDKNSRIQVRRCGTLSNKEGAVSHGGPWCRIAVSVYQDQYKLEELCAWGLSHKVKQDKTNFEQK